MKEVVVSEEEIAEYLFQGLIDLGYVPEESELDDIAMIIFEYFAELLDLEVMEDEE